MFYHENDVAYVNRVTQAISRAFVKDPQHAQLLSYFRLFRVEFETFKKTGSYVFPSNFHLILPQIVVVTPSQHQGFLPIDMNTFETMSEEKFIADFVKTLESLIADEHVIRSSAAEYRHSSTRRAKNAPQSQRVNAEELKSQEMSITRKMVSRLEDL